MTKFNRGVLKVHEYTSLRFAPTTDNDNSGLDTLVKAFHSILNHQMFKAIRGGQPVAAVELYADDKRAHYMVTVPTDRLYMMKEKLQSSFPGSGIKEHTMKTWPFVEEESETLIATLTLTKQPYFPIDMKETTMVCKDYMHVVEDMREDEQLFIQILLEPVENGWQNDLERGYEDYLAGEGSTASQGFLKGGGRMLDDALSNMAKAMTSEASTRSSANKRHREIKEFQSKLQQSAFHVIIRIAVQAPTYERRNDLVEGIAGSFRIASGHNHWQLSPVIRKKAALAQLKDRQMPVIGNASLLCDDEVKTMLRFPTREIQTYKLERMTPDEKKIDVRITENIIPMGTSIKFGEVGTKVGFSITDLDTASKARLFIAPPGSGKTKLAIIFKNGAMDAGHGGSTFDIADGQLYYDSIAATPKHQQDRLVLVNFANSRYPHIFNFSSLGRDADTVGEMFTEFFEVFFKTQSNYRMNSFLRKGSMTAFTSPDATFLELIMLLRDETFRNGFLPKIRKSHPDLFLWWKTEFPKFAKSDSQMTEILQPILYRLDELQFNPRLGPIFCGSGGKLDIYNWMDQGKWVLYNLSNGVFLENEQRMMMSFLNYAYWAATLARERLLQNGVQPIVHHKVYDEPQTYMNATPVTKLSISKSRKYRVSDNFFIQSPSQVIERDKELWTQILDMNPHILIGGGLSHDNLKIVSNEFGIPVAELKQLEQLEYHWYFKTYVGKESIPPFIFDARQNIPEYDINPELTFKWRQYFAPKTLEQVKEDMNARNFNLSVKEYRNLLESYDDPDSDDEEGTFLG